jgi:hypothetical protein
MKIRHFVIAATISSAALPAIATASTQDLMIQACGRAFAAKLGLATGDVPGYKLTSLVAPSTETLQNSYNVDFTVDMIARAPKIGTPVARATCVVSRHGAVISLTEEPVRDGAEHVALSQ